MIKSKKGLESQVLVWWIIGVLVLVLVIVAYFLLKNEGISITEHLKNLFRIRR